jgi:uncharacterized protein YndB with AHSA1/START domain
MNRTWRKHAMTINKAEKPVGLTRGGSYEFGLRKTFPVKLQDAWRFITSPEGIRIWLGEVDGFQMEKGAAYRTSAGETGIVGVVNPEVNIRLTWQPAGWGKPSIIQIRTIPTGAKTTISIHHENLPGADEREQMRVRWEGVMAALEKYLAG